MKKKSIKSPRVQKAFRSLRKLYSDIPDTKGCMENICKENGCQGYCCRIQSPSILYIEFLRIWNQVMHNWKWEDIVDVIEKSIRTYLSSNATKGCVLWDENTKLCRCHTSRGLSCYVYGITPDEEFNPRLEKFRQKYKDDPTAIFKEQCKLISTVDGSKITKVQTDAWWNRLVKIEESIGVDKKYINDEEEGTYRMPHDHILLNTCSDEVLGELTRLKLLGTAEEKVMAIDKFISVFKKNLTEHLAYLKGKANGK